MKLAVITDTHFGARSDNDVFIKNQKKFYENIFFPELKKNNVKTILHMGDLFDRRKQINFFTLEETRKMFLDMLKNNNIEMHIIVGNHDSFYKNSNKINSLELLLREYKNISVYSDDIKELVFDSCKIAMVPWLNSENTEKIFQQLEKTSSTIVMGHFEIEGFNMNGGSVCKHGLSPNIFSKFEKVYSGHFHTQSKKGNIEYIGAPYEFDWSDYNSKRGFYILDTNTKKMKFIENKYKIHHIIDYNDDNDVELSEIKELDTDMFEDSFVKISVKNNKNPAFLEVFVKKIQESNAVNIKIMDSMSVYNSDVSEELETEIDLENTDTTISLIEKFVDEKKFDEEKSKSIKTLMNELYVTSLKMDME